MAASTRVTYVVRFYVYQYGSKGQPHYERAFDSLDLAQKFRDKLHGWLADKSGDMTMEQRDLVWSCVDDGFLEAVDPTIKKHTLIVEHVDESVTNVQ